jgi:murein DD-endopeptidase MepM/ murein hydrolase activator NlpD
LRIATVGVQRIIARLRSGTGRRSATAVTFQRRSTSLARTLRTSPASSRPSAERLVPITAVAIVAIAVALSNVSTVAGGPTGNTSGAGSEPRIALGGAVADAQGVPGVGGDLSDPVAAEGNVGLGGADLTSGDSSLAPDDRVSIDGPFSADGTLIKPGSVETVVADGAALIRSYRVKSGDPLTGIARKFHVSMMTVWWANDLKNKDDLHIGQTLAIPPVSGVVVTVSTSDTLESLAARYHTDAADIIEVNQLDDPHLVVGQTLTIPGALSKPIPTPKPTPTPTPTPPKPSSGGGSSGGSTRPPAQYSGGSSSGGSTRPPTQYAGGKFAWPVAGGYISQYFHYGHYAIDIAADAGTRAMAAAGGTVIFAGWKNNGGGYQVWIAHGSGLYTTYNHMMSVSVGRGQHVSRGQQVGRVGMTGNATGPHLHFEVWRGPVWDGGTRVNPLIYL